jgi:GntR family transcriptional regulator
VSATHETTAGGSTRRTRSGRRQSGPERLRGQILKLISDQNLMPGDQLPTEPWLTENFSAGRSTVREALKLLEQEGLVDAVQGRGRFVSAIGSLAIERPITRYEGIAEMLMELGYTVTTTVLSVTEEGATAEQARALDIAEGDSVIRLVRLRFGDDLPLVFSTDVIVRDALGGPIAHRDWSEPITAALAANGHEITSSAAHLSAVNLPVDLARKYSLGGLDPWMLITETCITRAGRRVLVAEDYHRGDIIGFNVLRRR